MAIAPREREGGILTAAVFSSFPARRRSRRAHSKDRSKARSLECPPGLDRGVKVMDAVIIMPPRSATSGATSSRNHNRRASDWFSGLEGGPFVSSPPVTCPMGVLAGEPLDSLSQVTQTLAEPKGTLLLVQDPTDERNDLEHAARLAKLELIVVRNQGAALEILREGKLRIDLLFVMPQSSPAATLIRQSLELCPGLRVLAMGAAGRREEMESAYKAGTASVILQGAPVERIAVLLKQSLSAVRESQRRDLRRRQRSARHASDAFGRRGLREFTSWVKTQRGSLGAKCFGTGITGAIALLIGVGCAFALERFYSSRDRDEVLTNRILEGLTSGRGGADLGNAALLRWQAMQQIGLSRESNEASRQYYQDHLQELRRQHESRSSLRSDWTPGDNAPDVGEGIGSGGRASGSGHR